MAKNLMKAYRMNPDFEGIHASVGHPGREPGRPGFTQRGQYRVVQKPIIFSPYLLNYGYNALMSLDSNAVLLTQDDNDSYPLWMLQDAMGIRTDVKVINIDFLLLEDVRKKQFAAIHLPEMQLDFTASGDNKVYWKQIVEYILENYSDKSRPLFLSMTLDDMLHEKYDQQLHIQGFSIEVFLTRKKNWHVRIPSCIGIPFMVDYLKLQLQPDKNQLNIDYQNLNYIYFFKSLYDSNKLSKKEEADVKLLALEMAVKFNDPDFTESIRKEFD